MAGINCSIRCRWKFGNSRLEGRNRLAAWRCEGCPEWASPKFLHLVSRAEISSMFECKRFGVLCAVDEIGNSPSFLPANRFVIFGSGTSPGVMSWYWICWGMENTFWTTVCDLDLDKKTPADLNG
ncbi:hypothetical protein CEXT_52361 [Caerostris extrusa]|uniref:Uncharacterized protein n=1 Tax=Caerostris extrusa TaxID=172846 RepID=A0AAV4RUF9_CAEEX|nr:hypothetical protein CEXT_52361 [Caerostris extrusa]